MDIPNDELLQVEEEFLQENYDYARTKRGTRKKGGPYSKVDKEKRRNEVYRLHFDYGYSARKISEIMQINRNTINGDIDYWYDKICKNINILAPEYRIITTLQRMEIQLVRQREQLDKVTSNSERMVIERLIFDINSKILHTNQKLGESAFRINNHFRELLNDFLRRENTGKRIMTLFDKVSVSRKAQEKIQRIINEDKQRGK